jgi:hypothetical protein
MRGMATAAASTCPGGLDFGIVGFSDERKSCSGILSWCQAWCQLWLAVTGADQRDTANFPLI